MARVKGRKLLSRNGMRGCEEMSNDEMRPLATPEPDGGRCLVGEERERRTGWEDHQPGQAVRLRATGP
jgi:hypothetical protein